jgi:predicted RNA-binding protein with PIN domain
MARLFCVDGTNLVRTAFGYGGPAHQAQEQSDAEDLVAAFALMCEKVGAGVEVEVFFDGAFRAMPGPRPANLRVSFARGVSADELILDRARAKAWAKSGAVTVVTADTELGKAAQAEGAKWLRASHGASPLRIVRGIEERFSR